MLNNIERNYMYGATRISWNTESDNAESGKTERVKLAETGQNKENELAKTVIGYFIKMSGSVTCEMLKNI